MTPPPRFEPLRRTTRAQRAVAIVAGPGVWLAALVVLAFVVRERDAVELALAVVAVSYVVAFGVLLLGRRIRVREEREPPERPA